MGSKKFITTALTLQLAQQSEKLSSLVTQNDSLTNELAARDTETASLKQQLELTSHDTLEQVSFSYLTLYDSVAKANNLLV